MTKVIRYKVLIWLFAAFSLTTITQTFFPLSINRLTAVVIVGAVLIYSIEKPNFSTVFILLFSIWYIGYDLLVSSDKGTSFSDTVYFITTILLVLFVSDSQKFEDFAMASTYYKKPLYIFLIICEAILLYSYFDPACYGSKWDGSYYLGYTVFTHTAASASCLIASIVLVVSQDNRFSIMDLALLCIPAYGVFASGARTFLIPMVIIFILYINYHIKRKPARLFFLILTLAAAAIIFINSSLYEKAIYMANNQYAGSTFSDRFFSGRLSLWANDLQGFLGGSLWQKLVGHGSDYIYYYNESTRKAFIWGHNDIVNALVSFGLLGTVVYICIWFYYFKIQFQKFDSGITRVIVLAYSILPMLLNGMYKYQHLFISSIFIAIYCQNAGKSESHSVYARGEHSGRISLSGARSHVKTSAASTGGIHT